jgi:hypothetical protein
MEPGKLGKHCTNCERDNHNVETCKVNKKKEPISIVATKATNQLQKCQKNNSYTCHICGLNGHKMTYCPKFAEEASYHMNLELEPRA